MKLLFEIFVLPPFNCILLILIGLIILRWRFRLGVWIISIALLVLYAFNTPAVNKAITDAVHSGEPITYSVSQKSLGKAIVVLVAGKYLNATEYFGDTIRGRALERVRYGAFLHRNTGKPILVTGGDPNNTGSSEAHLMEAVLTNEFGVPVKWLEPRSKNTFESARNSWEILYNEGITQIYLVTHYAHMARAKAAFERAGFDVIPAPTIKLRHSEFSGKDLLPNSYAAEAGKAAITEWVGGIWYKLRY